MDPLDMEEDDGFGVNMTPDWNKQLLATMGSLPGLRKREAAIRQQQLQQATEILKQRRAGPSPAEMMFALSSAFAQPVQHRGLGSVFGNIMPVLGQGVTAMRQGQNAQQDALMALQNKYALDEIAGERGGIQDELAVLKLGAQMAPKVARPRLALNQQDGSVVDLDEGISRPVMSTMHIQALIQHPERAADFDAKFGAGSAAKVLQRYGSGGAPRTAPGGPTASQSGGF